MAIKEKMINNAHVEGWLYQYKLEEKVTGPNSKNPGSKYISGDIEIATDDNKTNIVTVHYTFVAPTYGSSGKENPSYQLLLDIANKKYKSIMNDGADEAAMFRIDGSVSLNEWYNEKDGKTVLTSVKRIEGNFTHNVNELKPEAERSTFDCDMLITNVKHIEANEEKGLPEKASVGGYIFDYRKAILPVDFSVVSAGAISYFEGLEATSKNPTFTEIRGNVVSEVVITRKEEESAFGDVMVKEYKNTRKDYVITWAKKTPYEYGEDGLLDAKFMKNASGERETHLATLKKNREEYLESKKKGNSAFAADSTKDEDFDF